MRRLRFFSGSYRCATGSYVCAGADRFDSRHSHRLRRRRSAGRGSHGQELGSNAVRTATSSGTGAYSVPSLPPGAYEITAKMASFKTFHVTDIELTVGQALTLNVRIGAGSGDGRSPGARRPDPRSRSGNCAGQQSGGRAVHQGPASDHAQSLRTGSAVSGHVAEQHPVRRHHGERARERNNNFLLDGVDNNDTSVPGGMVSVLGADPESTQEFRVITNNFNAEYGRNTGAIIDVVTKSGTNTFHGDAYEFGRWNAFGGARDWFNRASDGPQDPYIRHQFGFSVGGPIRKDKTFFFFNDEMDRFITTLTGTAIVPTAAFKTGVFNFTYVDPNTLGTNTVPVDLTPHRRE